LPFFFASIVHARESVFLVNDFADTGDKTLGLKLVGGPARIEVRKVHYAPQHFAPLAESGFPLRVEALKHRANHLVLVDILRGSPQVGGNIGSHVFRYTCPPEEHQHIRLRAIEQRHDIHQ
jgi:hypothetical protein